MSALHQAIDHCGGLTRLAAAIGVSPQRVSNWVERGVPAERCPDIERATAGAVRCEDLRPDVAWQVLREQALPTLAQQEAA
jgi:DNA-binding transcriptional regulator YdaS (Cro superfamily)